MVRGPYALIAALPSPPTAVHYGASLPAKLWEQAGLPELVPQEAAAARPRVERAESEAWPLRVTITNRDCCDGDDPNA